MGNRITKTVKSMDEDIWAKGIAAAEARGINFGEWLAGAIEARIGTQAGDRLILPDERPLPVSRGIAASWEAADRLFDGLGKIADGRGNRDLAAQVRKALAIQVAALTGVAGRQTTLPPPADQRPAIAVSEND